MRLKQFCPLFLSLAWFKGMQKEIRTFFFKQNQRNPEKQIRVYGRLIQRDVKILLYPADSVKHRIAMGEQRIASPFKRTAAGQVVVKRFAILRILLPVVRRQLPDFLGARATDREAERLYNP